MTNLLFKLLTGSNESKNQAQAEQHTVCNYSNNYYGDQVCRLQKQSN